MTDEVARLVLNDNYRQNQAISLMERMSVSRLGSKQHFIRTLESQGLLDRQIEFLPSDAELAERKARGQGLTRPELSVLLSYSKMVAVPAVAGLGRARRSVPVQGTGALLPASRCRKYADTCSSIG
jgi:NAD-specific glutamate dehydrogenase